MNWRNKAVDFVPVDIEATKMNLTTLFTND